MMKQKVLFFDFDGVLARKHTHPEEPFKGIPELLKELHDKEYKICCVSYNPCALFALNHWGVSELFTAIRAGSNIVWFENYTDEAYRCGLSKSEQILNIFNNELSGYNMYDYDCQFFDDKQENLDLVDSKLPHIRLKLINGNRGVEIYDIK